MTMTYYIIGWLAIGFITCVIGIIYELRGGRDVTVRDILLCIPLTVFGLVTAIIAIIALIVGFISRKRNCVVFRARRQPREQPYEAIDEALD